MVFCGAWVMEEKDIIVYTYSLLSKIIILFFRLFGMYIGYFFTLADNMFLNFIGVILLIFSLSSFLSNIFFIKMIFYNNQLETKWNILGLKFSKKLLYSDMEVMRSNSIFGGTIMFWKKRNRWQTAYFFTLDLLFRNREEIKNIKKY